MKLFPHIWLMLAFTAHLVFAANRVDLKGKWEFALDPLDRGTSLDWHQPPETWDGADAVLPGQWDQTEIPHCWTVDPRYFRYTGVAWYRRTVSLPPHTDSSRWFLRLEDIGERCVIWVNGQNFGKHDGTGLPIEIDVTSALTPNGLQVIAIAVDNRWDDRTLPGSREGNDPRDQVYPWLNYGGLQGNAWLEARPAVYLTGQKIETHLADAHTALVSLKFTVSGSVIAESVEVKAEIVEPGNPKILATGLVTTPIDNNPVEMVLELPQAQTWSLSHPRRYLARLTLKSKFGIHRIEDTFGIRAISVDAGEFRLNGVPIRLAGANRARGHSQLGGIDSLEAVDAQLSQMYDAGLRFSRLQHYPPSQAVLDWADRHGMLLIVEYPVWGLRAPSLTDPALHARFKREFSRMIRLYWNHPSVVGWSVGNEYASWTEAGARWTQEMCDLARQLDPTRPVTFAAHAEAITHIDDRPDGTSAFETVDFISLNLYIGRKATVQGLTKVHERWAEKPIFISEFGLRADSHHTEKERIEHFDFLLELADENRWICGISWWSFNDYPSIYPGTGVDGYRRWGMVDEFGKPYPLYHHVKDVMSARDWSIGQGN